MFVCNNIDYWPPLYLRGVVVKDEFNLITNKEAGLGCKNCGSRYFGDPNNASAPVRCRVTFNFCNILCREGPGKCGGQDGISEELAMARMNLTNGSYSRENVTNATALVEYGSANGSRVLDEESAGPRPVATPTSDALPLIGRPSIVSMDTF
ncbi:MAG: hypothetical protein M1814_002313 [Vezdaea aestivalis]|nr:MAG: hypothetical protein M1814_002313 [Vezdaea aestivalis]